MISLKTMLSVPVGIGALMKKRIILALAIFTSIFVLGGTYLIFTIEKATSTLDNLIELHQIEHLRVQLLIYVKETQSDLALQHTKFAGTLKAMVKNVVKMEDQANKCLGCHHTAVITEKLQDLKGQIYAYGEVLSRLLTVQTSATRPKEEENKAFTAGHKLIYLLDDMTSLTKANLDKRTQTTLIKIGKMKTLIFIIIVIGPIFAIGLAISFTQHFTRPLSALLQATRKLKSGDLSFRVQGLTDEFKEISISFNEMAASLNEQMHKMQSTEQMTIVGEMAARLVHEIKNPLAGIKGSMQVFQERAHITEEERTILSRVIDEVQRVESLMKSLLNFAKPPEPQLLPVCMNGILETTLIPSLSYIPSLSHSSEAPDASKTIRIVKNFDPHLPLTMADPLAMQQVFLNLIMNAVQAMPSGGTLTANTLGNPSAKEIKIEITDTGNGISDKISEKIFQPFFTTKHTGTGLGLTISKQCIEMHGGTLTAVKNPLGGATFQIILPSIQMEEAPPPDRHNVPIMPPG